MDELEKSLTKLLNRRKELIRSKKQTEEFKRKHFDSICNDIVRLKKTSVINYAGSYQPPVNQGYMLNKQFALDALRAKHYTMTDGLQKTMREIQKIEKRMEPFQQALKQHQTKTIKEDLMKFVFNPDWLLKFNPCIYERMENELGFD